MNNNSRLVYEKNVNDDESLFGSYVDLKAFANFFWNARWIMSLVLIVSIVIGQVYLLLATKKYSAVVSIAEKGASGSSSSLGGGDGGGVLAKLLLTKSESAGALSLTYAIKSTAVAERVVKAKGLDGEWLRERIDNVSYDNMKPEERFQTAVSLVQSEVKALSDKENVGLINVSITDIKPEVAYELLKEFLVELQYVMTATDLIFNKRIRLFYEDRMKVLDNRLFAFGAEIAKLYGTNKLSYDKSTFTYDNLPLENYTTDDFEFGVSSLDFLSKIHEDVRFEVKHIQNTDKISDKVEVPQQVYLSFLEDKYNMLRGLRTALTQYYEYALIEEKRNEQRFVVIEAPTFPTSPSEPKKLMVTVLSFSGGLFAAFWSVVIYYLIISVRRKSVAC